MYLLRSVFTVSEFFFCQQWLSSLLQELEVVEEDLFLLVCHIVVFIKGMTTQINEENISWSSFVLA